MLLTDNAGGSCLIIDPKGEALKLVGKMGLRPFGLPDAPSRYDIVWLDPFDIMKAGTWSLNPITRLKAKNPNASADARLSGPGACHRARGQNSHWDETARNFYTALLLYVAQYPGLKEPRDLVTAHRLLEPCLELRERSGRIPRKTLRANGEVDRRAQGCCQRRQCRAGARRHDTPELPDVGAAR